MNKISVIIEGYASQIPNGWRASSTVTLVECNDKIIIVDPGCNRGELLKSLSDIGFKTSDIDYVVLTHTHTDHALLAGIFENAKVLNNVEIYNQDEQIEHNNKIPETDIEVIQTPGHSDDSCALKVKVENDIYVIAGDVFWWMDEEEQKIDVNSEDKAHPGDLPNLIQSRKQLLDTADYIIPGHGKMFKSEK